MKETVGGYVIQKGNLIDAAVKLFETEKTCLIIIYPENQKSCKTSSDNKILSQFGVLNKNYWNN